MGKRLLNKLFNFLYNFLNSKIGFYILFFIFLINTIVCLYYENYALIFISLISFTLLFYHRILKSIFDFIFNKLGFKNVKHIQFFDLIICLLLILYELCITLIFYNFHIINKYFILILIFLTIKIILFFINETFKSFIEYPKLIKNEIDNIKNNELNEFLNRLENEENLNAFLKTNNENTNNNYSSRLIIYPFAILIISILYEIYDNYLYNFLWLISYSSITIFLYIINFNNSIFFQILFFIISLIPFSYVFKFIKNKRIANNLKQIFNTLLNVSMKDSKSNDKLDIPFENKNNHNNLIKDIKEYCIKIGLIDNNIKTEFIFYLKIVILILLGLIISNAILYLQINLLLNNNNFISIFSDGLLAFIGITLINTVNPLLKLVYVIIIIEGKIIIFILISLTIQKIIKLYENL